MKTLTLLMSLCAVVLLVAGCDKVKLGENEYLLINDDCASIIFRDNIGYDIESALDSLPKLNVHLINNREYLIKIEANLAVDFHKDDRSFCLIRFIDATFPYGDSYDADLFLPNVLDSYGNYYTMNIYCED